MTQQETVERDVRIALGDLHIQLIVTRAQVVDLTAQLAEARAALSVLEPKPISKVNGKAKEPLVDPLPPS